MEDTSVRVAVRIRPQIPKEVIEMCHVCTNVTPGEPQVVLGSDKAFTFDNVFDMTTQQDTIYETCIKGLIDGCLEGYNATVLAYGQTGSGKTYTMGTGFDMNISYDEVGIIPRAVHHLFQGISDKLNKAQENGQPPPEFKIVAQFMELYNEEIIDLLDPIQDSDDKGRKSNVKIHEDTQGAIYTIGLTSRTVSSADEALQCLKIGALSRTTASTQMNVQSSRSHAIFTLHVKQQRMVELQPLDEELGNGMESISELETLTAKFHFVDLAGSERLKRTGATGDRAKEGISINCGLLALGNVISALGDKARRATHVPYRDSKLTRLLQDSLGGNSQTLMIACISPSDRDFMETLNTLKYANRAKNIKNKVCINQDKSSQLISVLRREIQQLQLELMEYKQGKRVVGEDGLETVNDMFHENTMLLTENSNLRTRLKALQETLEHQTKRVTDLLAEKATGKWITSGGDAPQSEITDVIKGYLKEVEDLRTKLLQSEEICSQLRKQVQKAQTRLSYGSSVIGFPQGDLSSANSTSDLISEAKQEIDKLRKRAKSLQGGSGMEKGSKEELKQELEEEKANDTDPEVNGESNELCDIEDDEDGESSDDTDAEEKSPNEEAYRNDLVELTVDISMKERLIEELEQSQQRLLTMRRHYEVKVLQLEQKIRETEIERDQVLANLSSHKGNKSEESAKKVKVEYEKKLSTLQNELKKMQVAKKEHAQLMRNQSHSERQIMHLKNELAEMKRTKVRLINKMKEETHRHKNESQKTNREIAQLKKQSRVRENRIRNLEAEKRLKENVLKRKQEELAALRRTAKPMSDSVAGRVTRNYAQGSKRSLPFSPKVAKTRWQKLEKNINQLVMSKQAIYNIEKDMERFLEKRELLTKRLEALEWKKSKAASDKNEAVVQDYEDQIETLKANIDYCQENISECQTNIMQMEEAKDDMDLIDVKNLVFRSTDESSRYYLLEKLLSMVIHQTFQVFQKESTIKEMEARLEQTKSSNEFQVQLLEHLVQDGNPNILEFITSNVEPVSESQFSSRSSSPVDSSISEMCPLSLGSESPKLRHRKTGTPSEFLAVSHLSSSPPVGSCPSGSDVSEKPHTSRLAWSFGPALQQELDESHQQASSAAGSDRGIVRVTSAPTSLKEMGERPKAERSPLTKRKNYNRHLPDVSPAFRRKFYSNASIIPPSGLSRQSSVETTVSDITPPNSPSAGRKNREDNVFSRLTSGSVRTNKPGRGIIAPFTAKSSATKNQPFILTHIAEGHSRAVLSVAATDRVLFSGSKDRTVKVWDLATGCELQSLGGHPNNVVCIKYNDHSKLAFSVSTAFIKVWDIRQNSANCIKTLCSSGVINQNFPTMHTPSRTLIMPQGETQIHDISLNRFGTTLFSAASNIVRMWDLRMFQAIGKLSGGHQAAIMCLAVDSRGHDRNVVVTGSKDHYIKVFEVLEHSSGAHSPKMNLEPPHYDGIQSLALNGDILFSGSRDFCIKKWNLKTRCHVQSLNQAHKDWICALCFLPTDSLIASGCRGGVLKLWTTDTTQLIGEIKAHSNTINSIAANNSSVFTASNDGTVGIWRLRNSNEDLSPDNDGIEMVAHSK